MSFKFLKQMSVVGSMSSEQRRQLTEAQKILGVSSLTELIESTEITPERYTEWLKVIIQIANERGIALGKRSNFNEVAFEVLDNDIVVDMAGGENTKLAILSVLWNTYKANSAHTGITKTVAKAKEEEEAALADLIDVEDEEGGELTVGSATRRNPYPHGTLRALMWDGEHPTGAEDEQLSHDVAISDEDGDPDSIDSVDTFDGVADDSNMNARATADMSAEELAAYITSDDYTESDVDGEYEDQSSEDIETRVADLETRVTDLEGDDQTDIPSEPSTTASASRPISPRAEVEDEEGSATNIFHKAITSPKEHLIAALKDVEAEGGNAWKGIQLPLNPHPKKSQAYRAWEKGFKQHARAALGLVDKPRDVKPARRK